MDEKAIALQRSGRIGFYVPSSGQEACSVAHRIVDGGEAARFLNDVIRRIEAPES